MNGDYTQLEYGSGDRWYGFRSSDGAIAAIDPPGLGLASGFWALSLSNPQGQRSSTLTSDDITVVAWINGEPLKRELDEQSFFANELLKANLSFPVTCGTTTLFWFNGRRVLLETEGDRRYANAYLLYESRNDPPPTSPIKQSDLLRGGDFRLFNEVQVRVKAASPGFTRPYFEYVDAPLAFAGKTPEPCSGLANDTLPFLKFDSEYHDANGARDNTQTGGAAFQINEGRIGPKGQKINRTINACGNDPGSSTCKNEDFASTVPWVFSAVLFNNNGSSNADNLLHQMFPTYTVYVNGKFRRHYDQGVLNDFIQLNSSSQLTVEQVKQQPDPQ